MVKFELVKKVKDLTDYSNNYRLIDETSVYLKEFSQSLKNIEKKYEQNQVIDFYNNLITTELPLPISTAITTYLSLTDKLDCTIDKIDKLPFIVSELLQNKSDKNLIYEQNIISVFFKYIQNSSYIDKIKDASVNEKIITLSEKINKFNHSMGKIKHFFIENNIKDYFDLDMATLNQHFNGNWKDMIDYLSKKIVEVSMKPDKNEKEISDYIKDKKRIEILEKLEKEELIDLTSLSKIGPFLYKALNL